MDKFTIHGTLPSLNEYIDACRRNRYGAASLKNRVEQKIIDEIMASKLKPLEDLYPLTIGFLWYESTNRRDVDNVVFAKKFILDALVKAGVLPNDNRKFVKGFVECVYTDKDNPRIEVFLGKCTMEEVVENV